MSESSGRLAMAISCCLALGGAMPAPAGTVARLASAWELIDYGFETRSPEALVVAAGMLLDQPVTERVLSKIEKRRRPRPTKGQREHPKRAVRPEYNASELAAKAREMALGDDIATQLVERLELRLAERPRGRVAGVWKHCDRVEPDRVDRYEIEFESGELAEILVEGDGSTDLDCYVFNSSGSVIDSRADHFDTCLLAWLPGDTLGFAIEIENLGGSANEYCLLTN